VGLAYFIRFSRTGVGVFEIMRAEYYDGFIIFLHSGEEFVIALNFCKFSEKILFDKCMNDGEYWGVIT
jgi:hypothetical protein